MSDRSSRYSHVRDVSRRSDDDVGPACDRVSPDDRWLPGHERWSLVVTSVLGLLLGFSPLLGELLRDEGGDTAATGPVRRRSTTPAAAMPVPTSEPTPAEEPPEAPPAPSSAGRAFVYRPHRSVSERRPSAHPRVAKGDVVRVRVVTIRARVTAYTPYDHRRSKPEWADGIVAWHPNGRARRTCNNRYGVAADWRQFPPGATFVRIPGYMDRSYPSFPENFWVVDDRCGRSRRVRQRGGQPLIDVRYVTRYSAVHPRHGWGMRELEIEVIYPAGFAIPASVRPWVTGVEWRTYHRGRRMDPAEPSLVRR